MDDDRHLVKVGEKGLETLLRYSKFCDEKLEKVFAESSEVFLHATCRQDYTNDRRIYWSCSIKQEDQAKITDT